MRVLVACEFSGAVRDEFAKRGHDAWSCDYDESETDGNHYQGNVLDILSNSWDLLIAHPPCTYLSNAGVRHLHVDVKSRNGNTAKISGLARQRAMVEAADFFNLLLSAPILHICAENPIQHRYARMLIPAYTQIIHPWQFGHNETKATCLWLRNLPLLLPTHEVAGRIHAIHMMSPGISRSKDRSRTFPNIARAMAEQWGTLPSFFE